MVKWSKLFGQNKHHHHVFREQIRQLLPLAENEPPSYAIPPAEVTKVALRLKYQIEQVVPCELEEWKITKANSPVITQKVVRTAKEAGGKDYQSCVVYCLLVCHRWFKRQAALELWDADLLDVRATACEVLAKIIIETEEDQDFLLQQTLLKRYSILINNHTTEPANAIERAVDLHALRVIGSSGYQKCVAHLWRGWLVQDDQDPLNFIPFKNKANIDYWSHLDPDRMRAPQYQNAVQIFVSVSYLALYTGAINTINGTGDLDVVEGILYVMTAGFIFDEFSKFWKVGRYYIGFWNIFNSTLYALLCISFVTRMLALSHPLGSSDRGHFNELSYNFLAFSAPMFWMRLLLYLDTFRFFGAMLVVLKVMMKESLIFFALLVVVCIGFLQAFVGMHQADDGADVTTDMLRAMANSVMQSPDFDAFENYAPPFGLTLYYIFTFIVMVVLLNILIALYNSAYSDITDNAVDEYMALFSAKTMQFVRAPDENVFIAPFNLLEVFGLILPFEWWMEKKRYERLNNAVMGVIYSPLLLITAWIETRDARTVRLNRKRGEADDETVEEWEQSERDVGFEVGEEWAKIVESTRPEVATDQSVMELRELRELRERVESLSALVEGMAKKEEGGGKERDGPGLESPPSSP